jgi:hypothetical protein
MLAKINYELMELSVLFGMEFKKESIVSVGVACCGED